MKEKEKPKTGIDLVAEERQRQIEQLGFSGNHDSQFTAGEIALAAACYACDPVPIYRHEESHRGHEFTRMTPFGAAPVNTKHTELRKMIIAGALVVAEIDRLLAEEKLEASEK